MDVCVSKDLKFQDNSIVLHAANVTTEEGDWKALHVYGCIR